MSKALSGGRAVEARLRRTIPEDVRRALSAAQLDLLVDALKPPGADHLMELRSSFRFFHGRYYATFLYGRERRNRQRLTDEEQLDAVSVSIWFFVLAAAIFSYGLVPLLFVFYFIQSALGLDFIEGPSPLHDFICR